MSDTLASELHDRWQALLQTARLADSDDLVFDRLLVAWSEPHRCHHTAAHLLDTLSELERSQITALRAAKGARTYLDPVAVKLAAFLHDAVYRTERSDSEQASAGLARQLLPKLGASAPLIENVCRLVELTATHRPSSKDIEGAWLCDADLIVLASAPERYEQYRLAVRREYAHVPEPAWREGRARVLRGFLAAALYRLPGREAQERAARANLNAELQALSDTTPER